MRFHSRACGEGDALIHAVGAEGGRVVFLRWSGPLQAKPKDCSVWAAVGADEAGRELDAVGKRPPCCRSLSRTLLAKPGLATTL